jgi:RNA polymerase sigma factor (sigma-70 family)
MQGMQGHGRTLGDVLYASSSQRLASEKNWLRLVHSLASRDHGALHALYERTHRLVYTLIVRLTSNRETAEELTLELFEDLWRGASRYDAADGTVLGWIMNQARSKAIDWLRLQHRQKLALPVAEGGLLMIDTPDYRDVLKFKDQSARLRTALRTLTADERAAIDSAFFCGLTRGEFRSALHKLRLALDQGAKTPERPAGANPCEQAELVCAYAIRAVSPTEVASIEAHLSSCRQCRLELESLRSVVDSFVAWPTDVLRPSAPLQERLARSIARQDGSAALPATAPSWSEPEWEDVAPGISCKLLATDTEKHMVSMLVRLAPGGEYPAHTHAGREELHLLDGELWIDERKLHPGDYNRAEPGTSDQRVWSETGCSCVLMTSTRDALR